MHRQRLKAMLEKAELRMYEGAWRVARQQERIAEMSGRGVDLRPYRELLAQFEETQRLHVKHVQQIKKELYDPSGPKGERHLANVNAAPSTEQPSPNDKLDRRQGRRRGCPVAAGRGPR
jgi:hypothetical protein